MHFALTTLLAGNMIGKDFTYEFKKVGTTTELAISTASGGTATIAYTDPQEMTKDLKELRDKIGSPLDDILKKKFARYSNQELVNRINKAPDFKKDDEEHELSRRIKQSNGTLAVKMNVNTLVITMQPFDVELYGYVVEITKLPGSSLPACHLDRIAARLSAGDTTGWMQPGDENGNFDDMEPYTWTAKSFEGQPIKQGSKKMDPAPAVIPAPIVNQPAQQIALF